MGWSIGFDENWQRDIGYDVPAVCDHPKCNEHIHRGLAYVCGGGPYGESNIEYRKDGCGLFFCYEHLNVENRCPKCARYDKKPYKMKPDTAEWINWKLTDESWAEWRKENAKEVREMLKVQTKRNKVPTPQTLNGKEAR